VLSRYYGPKPHQLPVDDGKYHGNFQDVRLNLRYDLRAHPFAITPFVALGIPSNDYIYFAHSAAGTNQREYAARALDGTSSLFFPGHMCKGCMRFLYPEKSELRERIADGYTLRSFTDFLSQPVPKHDAFNRAFNRLTPETLQADSPSP
jgi:hypothetical protein